MAKNISWATSIFGRLSPGRGKYIGRSLILLTFLKCFDFFLDWCSNCEECIYWRQCKFENTGARLTNSHSISTVFAFSLALYRTDVLINAFGLKTLTLFMKNKILPRD